MCIIVDLKVKLFSCEVNIDKEGLLVIDERMMTEGRNQSAEKIVKYHFVNQNLWRKMSIDAW